MAITVAEDLVHGAKFRIQKNLVTFVRIFVVSGLDPADPVQTFTAYIQPGIPQYLQPHPQIAGLYVSDVQTEPLMKDARTAVKLTITYSTPEANHGGGGVVVEISGATSIKEIQRYPKGSTPGGTLDGQPILIPYSPAGKTFAIPNDVDPAKVNFDPANNGGIYYDYASIPMLSPNTILTFTRQIAYSNNTPGNGPLSISQQSRRHTNANTWNGGSPGTWLCRTFDSKSLGSPLGQAPIYQQRIAFEWDPDGWAIINYYRSSIDGKPPSAANVSSGTNNGYILVDYPRTDFAQLGLPAVY